jgi:hypothetical protein
MDAPTDPAKLRAALEHLEAVQAQRLAEKIANGEIVSVPLYVVAGSQTELRSKVEEAKASAVADLRATGDQREVVFTGTVVVTGVRGPGEAADPASVPSAPSFFSPEDRAAGALPLPSPRSATAARNEVSPGVAEHLDVIEQDDPQPPVIETYVCVQVRQCRDDDDAGEICEAWFSVTDGQLTLTSASGKYITSRAITAGEDPKAVAKRLLREKKVPEGGDFNRMLHYPNAGLA